MVLLDGMIQTRRFFEFITEFVKIHNKEQEERTTWEFYIHRIFDVSYNDFRDSISAENKIGQSSAEVAETVAASSAVLKGFIPVKQ